MREIKNLVIDFGPPEGSWTFNTHDDGTTSVGGRPCPSESQAHFFDTVVLKALTRLVNLGPSELAAFLAIEEFSRGD